MRLAIKKELSHIVHLEEAIDYMNERLARADYTHAKVILKNRRIAERDLAMSKENLKCKIGLKDTTSLSDNLSEAK